MAAEPNADTERSDSHRWRREFSRRLAPRVAEGMPPGPALPWPVQSFRYLTQPLALLEHCARELGDAFTLSLGPTTRWVVVHSPALVEALLKADTEVFLAGRAKASIFAPVVGTTSSLTLDGPAHATRRRVLSTAFGQRHVSAHATALNEMAEREVASWPRGRAVPFHPLVQRLLLESIVRATFGDADAELLELFEVMTREVVNSRLLLLPALQKDLGAKSPWGRLLGQMAVVRRAVEARVRARVVDPGSGGEDLLSLLLGAKNDLGAPLSVDEVVDEALTMIVAGHEITGISATWLVGRIASLPTLQTRLRRELASDTGDALTERVVKESLRLDPAVAVGTARRVVRDTTLGGFAIPAGTTVVSSPHLLHRRSDLYADPDRFDPDRFGGRINPYQWIPFGGGPRRCLGMGLAMQELKTITATVFRHLVVDVMSPLSAARRGAFVAPADGLLVKCTDVT